MFALVLACAVPLYLPRTAHAAASYTLEYTSGWTAVPASTINLDTIYMGDPDDVQVSTGSNLIWLDSDDGIEDCTWYCTHSSERQPTSGLFVEKSTNTTESVSYTGEAMLVWEDVGTDAEGDRIDLAITVADVSMAAHPNTLDTAAYFSALSVDDTGQILIGSGTRSASIGLSGFSASYTVSFTKSGTSEPAEGTYLFFISDLDSWSEYGAESVTLVSGFDETVYLYDSSDVVVSNSNTTFSANTSQDSGWASGSDDPSAAICATASSGTCTLTLGSGTACNTYLFDEMGCFTVSAETTSTTGNSGGTVSPEGETTVWWKNDVTYTIETSTGYEISDVVVDGDSVGAVDTYTFESVTSEHTIEVIFEPITYTVSYEPNAGDDEVSGMPSDTECSYDDEEGTIPDDVPERTGYTFTGWNTEEDGSDESYQPGDPIVNLTTEDGTTIPLYAQWAAVISVQVPTTVACCILPDGTVMVPSGYAIKNLSVVDVETSAIEATDVYKGTETFLYQSDELVFSTTDGYLAPIGIETGGKSEGLEWKVADMDPEEDAELMLSAAESPVTICDVTFTFQESEG